MKYADLGRKVVSNMEKLSIDNIKEDLKKIEKQKLEIATAGVKLTTSLQRKKQQLQVDETAEERDINDEITNAV